MLTLVHMYILRWICPVDWRRKNENNLPFACQHLSTWSIGGKRHKKTYPQHNCSRRGLSRFRVRHPPFLSVSLMKEGLHGTLIGVSTVSLLSPCIPPSQQFLPRLFIHRPAALSAVCLNQLGRIWNVGEGGPLCTKQANQHSIFCTASVRSTEYTVLAGLLCTQLTIFT